VSCGRTVFLGKTVNENQARIIMLIHKACAGFDGAVGYREPRGDSAIGEAGAVVGGGNRCAVASGSGSGTPDFRSDAPNHLRRRSSSALLGASATAAPSADPMANCADSVAMLVATLGTFEVPTLLPHGVWGPLRKFAR
jgi:hypothetical protein